MGRVRPFVENDIEQVADLHGRVFRKGERLSEELRAAYRDYYKEILCNNPWGDEDLPSLVYEEAEGEIVGFLGLLPRRMSMNGQPVRAAVSNNYMVEAEKRASMAALQLLRAFFRGPQDLSIAEAITASRRLWEGLGGTTSLLSSLHWTRALRPARFMASRMADRRPFAPIRFAVDPVSRLADSVAVRLKQSPFHQPAPSTTGEDLTPELLLECVSEFSKAYPLRPEYDAPSLRWLLDVLSQKRRYGRLCKTLVLSSQGKRLGWYLYYVNPGGIGEVVQVMGTERSIGDVLDHLLYDAWREGLVALSGRIEPRFTQQLTDKRFVFDRCVPWMLVHAKNPDLIRAIQGGDAFLTRLEGEWWVSCDLEAD